MTEKWPRTNHWQRLGKVFRETHGSRWRSAAAEVLQIDRRDLRSVVDRDDLTFEQIKWLDHQIIDHLRLHTKWLQDLTERANS